MFGLVRGTSEQAIQQEKVGHPTPLDIAKSMAWSTKPDVCLAVHRGNEAVEIHCTKARWYWNAKLGCVKLKYNAVNGRYAEIEEQEKMTSTGISEEVLIVNDEEILSTSET